MKRWQLVFIATAVTLAIAVVSGYYIGVRLLRDKVVAALGPGSRLTELKVNWFTIELLGVSIDAPKGWPAARTFEAERIVITPDLRTLFTKKNRIFSIVVEKPYLSVLRNPGKLVLVPSLTEREQRTPSTEKTVREVEIARIELKDGSVDLYDATVSRPPHKTRIEEINALIKDVAAPAAEKTSFELTGIVKGVKRDGSAKVTGWVGPSAIDSSSLVILEAVDLVALQPYLIKKTDARVSRGTLDLNLASEVRNNNLKGKGKIILKDLTFAPSSGFFDTFMGMPRAAIINFLKDNNNAIDVDFTLTGNTKNPNFSLNESLSTRVATAMAGQLGVGIVNAAESLGTLGRKGVEGAGSVVEGVGSAVQRLFGR
ncbi:MAG TPA: DUF748 domain-containing protein [Candidatus Binatia bacterium]|nr:DUF748 domain-containing protein [Candidatus Binatia bacterium]